MSLKKIYSPHLDLEYQYKFNMRKRFDNSYLKYVPSYAITKILTSTLPAKPFMQEKLTKFAKRKKKKQDRRYSDPKPRNG